MEPARETASCIPAPAPCGIAAAKAPPLPKIKDASTDPPKKISHIQLITMSIPPVKPMLCAGKIEEVFSCHRLTLKIIFCIMLNIIRYKQKSKEERRDHLKTIGIVRKVDELGRIVLPIELRRTLDIAVRDELEIYLDDDKVILRKYEPSCIFCDASRNLVSYEGKNICSECAKKIGKL